MVDTTSLLLQIAFQTVALLLTALILPGLKIKGLFSALVMVVLLSFVNQTVWSGNLFYAIPNSLSIQTLQVVLINAFLFWLLVKFLPGLESKGIVAPLLAPIIFTVITGLFYAYGLQVDWAKLLEQGKTTIDGVKTELEKSHPGPKNSSGPTPITLPGPGGTPSPSPSQSGRF